MGHCGRYLAGRTDVATKDPAGRPGRYRAQWEVSTRQEQEARAGKLPGYRMSHASEQQVTSLHRTAQISHQAGSVVGHALSHSADRRRPGGGDDQAASFGQRHQAPETGKPSRAHDDGGPFWLVDSSERTDSPDAGAAERSLRSPDAIS
jgi:hypothetical protein